MDDFEGFDTPPPSPFDGEYQVLAPRKVQRKLLEKDIQKACVTWARSHGWWARKFSSPANRSVPDYLFAKDLLERRSKHGTDWAHVKIAVEFKALGKTSTSSQTDEQLAMSAAGWDVYEIDDIEKFKRLFTEHYS